MRTNYDDRRNTRIEILLAVFAVIWGLWKILRKMAGRALGLVTTPENIYYCYIQITMLVLALCVAVLLVDTITFLIADLLRYNVLDNKYKNYDCKSDCEFAILLRDGKLMTIIAFFFVALLIPVTKLYDDESVVLAIISLIILFVVLIVFLIYFRRFIFLRIAGHNFGSYMFRYGFAAEMALLFILTAVSNDVAVINVVYDHTGLVSIANSCDSNYENLDISIHNIAGETVFDKNVASSELLKGKEVVVSVYEGAESNSYVQAEDTNYEKLHWKYMLDISQIGLEDGEYYMVVRNKQKSHKVELYNMFVINGDKYEFAKDNMEKEY